jgi:prephenate dehydrogenase
MTSRVTIIGLGQIGASIGLCLASKKNELIRTGHDRKPEIARQAGRLGAVDKTEFNLHKSVEGADIVILAIPVDEIHETLRQISPDLKENVLLLDTSYAMSAVSGWVKELLPPVCHFAAVAPGLNGKRLQDNLTGIDAASADLFQNSTIVITSLPGAHPDTLQMASDLAALLGATPLYADPLEFEGWISAVHLLPQLTAACLVRAVIDQPGWRDSKKLAGQAFYDATSPAAHPDELNKFGNMALLNQAAVLRLLNDYAREMETLRLFVEGMDQDGLQKWLEGVMADRSSWVGQRMANNWEPVRTDALPGSGEVLGSFFGIRPKKILPGKKL